MPTLSFSFCLSGLQAVCRSAAKSLGRWFSHPTLAFMEGGVEHSARSIIDSPPPPLRFQGSLTPPPHPLPATLRYGNLRPRSRGGAEEVRGRRSGQRPAPPSPIPYPLPDRRERHIPSRCAILGKSRPPWGKRDFSRRGAPLKMTSGFIHTHAPHLVAQRTFEGYNKEWIVGKRRVMELEA
jgi:hypothetical protein